MAEFAPIRLDTTEQEDSDLKKLELKTDNPEFFGDLVQENKNLELYIEGQRALIEKHLNSAKAKAKKEHLGYISDDEDSYNRDLQEFQKTMNQILELAVSKTKKEKFMANRQEELAKAKERGDTNRVANLLVEIYQLQGVKTLEEILQQYPDVSDKDHFKNVKEAFGPELESWIKNFVNKGIEDINKKAEARKRPSLKDRITGKDIGMPQSDE